MTDLFPVEDGKLSVIDLTGGFRPLQTPEGITTTVFRTICSAIHTMYLHNAAVPEFDDVLKEYPRITQADLAKAWPTEHLSEALRYRGVPWEANDGLSMAQEHLLMALSDPTDRRTPQAIMRANGVSGTTYRTWMRNPLFSEKLHRSSVAAYADYLPLARSALISEAMDGKFQALELLFRITGEYSPETEAIGDLKAVISKLVESVLKNVQDENAKRAILADADAAVLSLKMSNPRALER